MRAHPSSVTLEVGIPSRLDRDLSLASRLDWQRTLRGVSAPPGQPVPPFATLDMAAICQVARIELPDTTCSIRIIPSSAARPGWSAGGRVQT